MNAIEVIAKLMEHAKEGNIELDDYVIDIKEQEASNINNEGPEGQLTFLLRELGISELEKMLAKCDEDTKQVDGKVQEIIGRNPDLKKELSK
jgi:hypothetical protein